uniref:Uncharacterized protein n=1 Tax=Anguilla anguilla TaxID=7936 RepID=A0A0E9U0P7_ANGAN
MTLDYILLCYTNHNC